MPRRRRVAVAFVTAVMTLGLLAACGGDDSESARATDGSTPAPSTTPSTAGPPTTAAPAPEGIPGVVLEVFERPPGSIHTEADVEYPGAKPPSAGFHSPSPLPCGYYDQPVRDENAVHTLEHGGVWLAFAPPPATSDADVATIQNLAAAHPWLLAAPYQGLNKPVVLVAWERRLEVDSVSDPRVMQFITTYTTSGSAPEAGVGC